MAHLARATPSGRDPHRVVLLVVRARPARDRRHDPGAARGRSRPAAGGVARAAPAPEWTAATRRCRHRPRRRGGPPLRRPSEQLHGLPRRRASRSSGDACRDGAGWWPTVRCRCRRCATTGSSSGSSAGQVYAFPATCDGEGCAPDWVGRRRRRRRLPAGRELRPRLRHVRRAVRVPGGMRERRRCVPAGVERRRARTTGERAARARRRARRRGVVLETGRRLAAYPAVCGRRLRARVDRALRRSGHLGRDRRAISPTPWPGGKLMAFDLVVLRPVRARCGGRRSCRAPRSRRGPRAPPWSPATGCSSATTEGRLWVFRSTASQARCEPIGALRRGRHGAAHAGRRRRPRDRHLGERRARHACCSTAAPTTTASALVVRSLGRRRARPRGDRARRRDRRGNDAGALEAFR